MKPVLTGLLAVFLAITTASPAHAQIDSSVIKNRITVFADSLVRSYYEKDWNTFIALTHPGIARLYGSMNAYSGIMQNVRARFEDVLEEKIDSVTVKQFVLKDNRWQCIVERLRETNLQGKKAKIWSYMVGQSKDDTGTEWKFFDVAENMLTNISAIMPDLSDELVVPEKKIWREGDDKQIQPKPKPKPKKKTAVARR